MVRPALVGRGVVGWGGGSGETCSGSKVVVPGGDREGVGIAIWGMFSVPVA
jgi:hypothetical protein